jgi:hypothetical protein
VSPAARTATESFWLGGGFWQALEERMSATSGSSS